MSESSKGSRKQAVATESSSTSNSDLADKKGTSYTFETLFDLS